MTDWIPMPTSLVYSKGEPLLVEQRNLDPITEHYVAAGANLVELNIAQLGNRIDFFEGMKQVLSFPDWCGNGWESLYDAFEEIGELWPFPFLLTIHGLPELLQQRCHFALHTVIRLTELSSDLSRERHQVEVIYVGSTWT